ncbi:MAG: energy-coupling factor transporter transmembrane protein EcfT, partial [Malacoplasma sp.]
MTYNGYLYRNSVIHRMNPSLKFITTILFIAMIFIPYGFFFQIILFVLIIGIYFLAKLPMRKLFKICQSVLFMMFVLLIINWVAYKGPGVVFDFGNQADLLYKPSWLAQSNN